MATADPHTSPTVVGDDSAYSQLTAGLPDTSVVDELLLASQRRRERRRQRDLRLQELQKQEHARRKQYRQPYASSSHQDAVPANGDTLATGTLADPIVIDAGAGASIGQDVHIINGGVHLAAGGPATSASASSPAASPTVSSASSPSQQQGGVSRDQMRQRHLQELEKERRRLEDEAAQLRQERQRREKERETARAARERERQREKEKAAQRAQQREAERQALEEDLARRRQHREDERAEQERARQAKAQAQAQAQARAQAQAQGQQVGGSPRQSITDSISSALSTSAASLLSSLSPLRAKVLPQQDSSRRARNRAPDENMYSPRSDDEGIGLDDVGVGQGEGAPAGRGYLQYGGGEPQGLRAYDHSLSSPAPSQGDSSLLLSLSRRFNMSKFSVVVVGFTSAALLLFLGLGASVLTNMIGFVYPIFKSFKTIEEHRGPQRVAVMKYWLEFWVVYGLFTSVEHILDLFLSWFPFYYTCKVLFLLWCFLPQFRGADTVYKTVVHPLFLSHQQNIDRSLLKAQRTASVTMTQVREHLGNHVRQRSEQIKQAITTTGMEWIRQQSLEAAARSLTDQSGGGGRVPGGSSRRVRPMGRPRSRMKIQVIDEDEDDDDTDLDSSYRNQTSENSAEEEDRAVQRQRRKKRAAAASRSSAGRRKAPAPRHPSSGTRRQPSTRTRGGSTSRAGDAVDAADGAESPDY